MRTRIAVVLLAGVLSLHSFAQNKKELTDDLVKDKQKVLAKYIPMANGDYLHKLYVMPSEEVLARLSGFKTEMNKQADAEKDAELKGLMLKDIAFYAGRVLDRYVGVYGMDSVGMSNLMLLMEKRRTDPKFNELMDAAHKKAFIKRMEPAERKRMREIIDEKGTLNDEALFKRSASYRAWLDDKISELRNTKYKSDTTLGYEGNYVVKLKVIENELPAGYIKDYLFYKGTGTVIKTVRNDAAKEEAYRNFMAKASNAAYKKEMEEVYANYKMMTANAFSPDFNYTDVNGKMVSLKSLRGKYVYIDVWATWCGPCKMEIPHLTKVEADYHGKNIHFVSLSVDQQKDKSKWTSYVKDNKLGGIQLLADKDFDSDFVKKYNINAIPRFILIDPTGKIVSGDAKRPSDPLLRKQLDTLLK